MPYALQRPFAPAEVAAINASLANAGAPEIVRWAAHTFSARVTLACSFGAEDMVLVDLLARAAARPRIFVLDTGRLHQETYDAIEAARARYGLEFEVFCPRADAVEGLLRAKGPNSFYETVENRKECCAIRKLEPLARALSDVDAWMTGLRRAQSVTRTWMGKAAIDAEHGGILKINPLVEWSEADVWAYIRENDVPYNRLHDQGFPSIGCAPCTRAVAPGEGVRAGRWWWESPDTRECGLHGRGV